MINKNFVRGGFLIAISLLFGGWSYRYPVGQFSNAGPGLFPLMISCLVLLIGVTTVVRAYFAEATPLTFNFKNMGIVLASLCGFALLSTYLNMTVGIVFLVFSSTYAGTSYSVVRNLKVSAVLLAIAFAMSKLLGVNLPLF